jgi:hypothetical protein
MSRAQLDDKLKNEDRGFVWLKRQVNVPVAQAIADLKIKGVFSRMEYKRTYGEGEAAAHVVGFTNVENIGQEGMELAFNTELAGKSGLRRVIKNGFSISPTNAWWRPSSAIRPKRAVWWWPMPKRVKFWPWPITPASTPTIAAISRGRTCAIGPSPTPLSPAPP